MGQYDIVTISEAPDDKTLAKLFLSFATAGEEFPKPSARSQKMSFWKSSLPYPEVVRAFHIPSLPKPDYSELASAWCGM